MSARKSCFAARAFARVSVVLATFAALQTMAIAQTQPANASFESPALSSLGRTASPASATWTFAGTAGIERLPNNAMAFSGGYNGHQAAYLSGTGTSGSLGSIAQNLYFPRAGSYSIRFMAGRLGAANAVRVSLDGVAVGPDVAPRAVGSVIGGTPYPQLEAWWTQPFSVSTAGVHEVKLAATNSAATLSGGDVLYVDQIVVSAPGLSFANSSFEGSLSGITLNNSERTSSTIPGTDGTYAMVVGSPGESGSVQWNSKLFAGGQVSFSLRVAKSSSALSCPISIGTADFGPIAYVPAPTTLELVPHTTEVVTLPPGNTGGKFTISSECEPDMDPPIIDSLIVNRGSVNFVDASFETPDIGSPPSAQTAPRVWLPSGSPWTFTGNAGIEGNPGSSASGYSVTEDGKQFGTALNGTFSQTVNLPAGAYVVVSRASAQPFAFSVNGVWQAVQRGTGMPTSDNLNFAFSEVMSEPIVVATAGPVVIAYSSESSAQCCFGVDTPSIIQLYSNTVPQVSLALSVNGAAPGSVVAAGVTLNATATASDADGLAKLRVLRNGVALAPDNTATAPASATSPYSATISSLSAGTHTFVAEATDHLGGVATTATTTVNACAPTITLTSPSTSSETVVAPATMVTINLAATATQLNTNAACGTISSVDFLVDGVVAATVVSPSTGNTYTTTYALPPRANAYAITARVTEASARTVTAANSAQVTVNSNGAPTIQSIAPVDVASLTANTQARVRAVATTTSGSISTLNIQVQPPSGGGSVQPANCSNNSSCDVVFVPTVAGLYNVTVTATASNGLQATMSTLLAASEDPFVDEMQLPGTVGVGTTAGQFAVSEGGAATYSIPVQIAPGINGVQPSLALTYNSQGGDGHVGVGWGLSGTSYITRCPKTIATDGIREAINYDGVTDLFTGNDAFCLDGQRLVPVANGLTSVACEQPILSGGQIVGWQPATCKAWEVRTEVETYNRILAISDNSWASNGVDSGPTRFRVYTKSGQLLEYGSRWWGIAAPRPNPLVSLVANPDFEDTILYETVNNPNCWLSGGEPCRSIIYPPPNTTAWPGDPVQGYFKTWNTGASSAGWFFGVNKYNNVEHGNSGVQKNNSSISISGPYTSNGTQTAFLQQLGWAATRPVLYSGKYTLGFKLAGRPAGSTAQTTWGGNQTIVIQVDGNNIGFVTTTSGQPFTNYSVVVEFGGNGLAEHEIRFVGQRTDDQTALLDAITLVPLNDDIYTVKVFPLDRVEDRSGNYMHIDYGGTHNDQILRNYDGTTTTVEGTLVDSYGRAVIPETLPETQPGAGRPGMVVAQGARPALEMFPRRFTYGMRTATPGGSVNTESVTDIEVARVILNYESRPDVNRQYDTGAGQMLLSKRLKSIVTTVGGSDDTSLRTDRVNFHQNEKNGSSYFGSQCVTGDEAMCGTKVRWYTLNYSASGDTGRSRLDSVSECAPGIGNAPGSNGQPSPVCLPSTTFNWSQSAPSLSVSSGSAASGTVSIANAGSAKMDWNNLLAKGRIADIVGDGRSRIIKHENNDSALLVCTLTAGAPTPVTCQRWAVTPPSGMQIPNDESNDSWYLSDYTGDGIADLVVVKENSAFVCPAVSSTAGGVLAEQFGTCFSIPAKSGTRSTGPSQDRRYYGYTGDFNGDGRMDIAFYRGNGAFEICLAPFGASSCQLAETTLGIKFGNASDEKGNHLIADFNGDGRSDIAYRIADVCITQPVTYNPTGASCSQNATQNDRHWSVCFASGKDGSIALNCVTRTGAGPLGAVEGVKGKINKLATYDFNGDGLADLATKDPNGGWRVCLSTGDGEFERAVQGEPGQSAPGDCKFWPGPSIDADKVIAGDFNGDGRTDLMTYITNSTAGHWQLCLSTGIGFKCHLTDNDYLNGPPQPANCDGSCVEAFVGDFNGDGRSELVVNAAGTSGTLHWGMNTNAPADILSRITTGLGATTDIAYKALSDPQGVYSKAAALDAEYPDPPVASDSSEVVIQSPMYVVSSTLASTSSGSSQYYKTSYGYQHLRADKQGRGLYGFHRRSIVDNVIAGASGNVIDDTAKQYTEIVTSLVWPLAGRPVWTRKTVGSGTAATILSTSRADYVAQVDSMGIARTNGVGGTYQRYRTYQTVQVQNPRHYANGTLLSTAQRAKDLDGSLLPTTIVWTGIEPQTNGDANPFAALSSNFRGTPTEAFYDLFDNPKRVVTTTFHPTSAEVWTQKVVNSYDNDSTRWLLGKLRTATTTSQLTGKADIVRSSSFTYQGYGGTCTGAVMGALCTETVEPGYASSSDRSLWQQTAYQYDPFGNRNQTTVSFYKDKDATGGLQSRQSDSTFLYGKYVQSNTRRYLEDSTNTRNLTDTREYGDGRCGMPTKLTDANGNYATTEYDGFCRKVRETAWTHDFKRAKQTTFTLSTEARAANAAAGATGLVVADGEKYALETRNADVTSSDQRTSIQYYDNLQRVVRAQARTFDGSYAQSSTYFDALGRQRCSAKQVSGSNNGTSATCAGSAWTVAAGSAVSESFYDVANRVVTEKLPDGEVVHTHYRALTTRVIRTNRNGAADDPSFGTPGGSKRAHITSKTANAKGLVVEVNTGSINNTASIDYTVLTTASVTALTSISSAYDAIGNLTEVRSPGTTGTIVVKTMGYDVRGRQTSLMDPDAGKYDYGYNGLGEQVKQTDARGYITFTKYDSFGRKEKRREGDPSAGQPASVDAGGILTEWKYDTCDNGGSSRVKGLLCSVSYDGTNNNSDNATSKATTYDLYARPIITSTKIVGKTFQSQVAYDAKGRPQIAVYPQVTGAVLPLAIRTQYNAVGSVEQISNASTGFVYQFIKSRNADGQLQQAFLASNASGTVKLLTQDNGYSGDGLARIASINISGGASLTQTFGFESIGNLKTRNFNNAGDENFSYDALDRLVQSAGASDAATYTIDLAGNLTLKGSLALGYATSAAQCATGTPTNFSCNRLVTVGSAPVVHDESGNIKLYSRPTTAGGDGATLSMPNYTAFNLPTSITKTNTGAANASASFAYDAGYQRIRQVKFDSINVQREDRLYVVPGGFEVKLDISRNVTESTATISGPDGAIATVSTKFDPATGLAIGQTNATDLSGNSTVTRALIKDHLSSMVAEVVVLGTAAAPTAGAMVVHGFGPWGNARNTSSPLNADNRGFTGHEHLAELGLIHMNGRIYDPFLGRFLQADPIIQAPDNAQSHNRYAYVTNNPLSVSDPSGFSWWTQWRRPILALAAAWILGPGAYSFLGITTGSTLGIVGAAGYTGVGAAFGSAVAAGFAAGGIQGGNIQSALQGAFSAALFYGVGQFVPGDAGSIGKVMAHAAAGCASAAVAGGSCRAGAISAGFAEFAGPKLGNWGGPGNFAKHVAIAAVGARLAGGKADKAAMTAAFAYLFNHGMAAAAAAARTTVAATATTCACGGKQGAALDYETGVPPQVPVGPKLPDIGGFIADVGKLVIMITPIGLANQLISAVLNSDGPKDAPNPNDFKDPNNIPDGWEWRGGGKPGGREGAYHNPSTGESMHDDRTHPEGKDPHWTYADKYGRRWDNFGGGWTPQSKK